jgi:hypothetical protein
MTRARVHCARIAALAGILGVLPAVSAADVFVIPLTGVDGTYAVGPSPNVAQRTATFHLPGTPAVIRGVSLHAVGTTSVGVLICDDGPAPSQEPWPAYLLGEMSDSPNQSWNAEPNMPLVSGPIDVTAPFTTTGYPGHPAGTWDFLAGGSGTVTIGGGPGASVLGCSSGGAFPTVTLTQVWLLVDADIPVAAHGASWGSVKAIYR